MNQLLSADLHIHSTHDGTASVPAILARAAASGLSLVAITDHTRSRAREAAALAADFGIEVVMGEKRARPRATLALFIHDERRWPAPRRRNHGRARAGWPVHRGPPTTAACPRSGRMALRALRTRMAA